MKWKWLEGKFDKHQDFYLNTCSDYFMSILADASANVSGAVIMPMLFVLYMCYQYAIWLSLFLYGQYYFLEAIASLGVNLCTFVTRMDFIFQSCGFIFSKLFFLTYSLLPPAGMYWQKVEVFREYVAAVRSAVWILEAVASLGIRWLNVPVIASEPFSKLKI